MTYLKRYLAIALVIVMCFSVCSCKKSKDTSSDISGMESSSVTEGTSSFDDEFTSSSAELSSEYSGSQQTQSPAVNSSQGTGSTSTPSNNKKHTLALNLSEWHPGVYGYDATYTLIPLLDDEMVNASQITYQCSTAGVKFSGNTVIIPSSVRQLGKPVVVTASEKTSGLKANLSIKCKKWENTFNDDFNGTAIDSSKWQTFEEGSGGTISMQYRDNAVVSDGKLNLIVKKENMTFNGKTFQYTQGGICTNGRFNQTYGLFTASMKIPKQPSLNSAFWLLPGGTYGRTYMAYDSKEPTKGLSEIDIVETSYYWNNTYCIGEHFYDTANSYTHSSKGKSYVGINKDLSDNYVEYSCAWLESGLYYYADGILLYTDNEVALNGGPNHNKQGRPAYMILTLGVYDENNTWCGPYSELEKSTFPITLYVDFARAYK